MAIGDFVPFESSNNKFNGSIKYAVASGTTASIKAGEPVEKLAGTNYVKSLVTNAPTATDRIVGIAASASTETATAVGTVDVIPATNGQMWLGNPKVAATWNTQALYNALIGSRVLIDLTSGVYTLLSTDGAGNGCIIEYLDISRYPGKVCFSFSALVDYRNV